MAYPKKRVIQYDIDGNEIARYDSLGIAAKAIGITAASLSVFLAGKRKTPVCAGFVWKYEKASDAEDSYDKPKRNLPVDPYSDEYKWLNFRERIERRNQLKNKP